MTDEKFLIHTVSSLKSDLENKALEFKKAKEFFDLYLRQNKLFVCDKENEKFYIQNFDRCFSICVEKCLNVYSCKFTPYYQECFELLPFYFKETNLEQFNQKFTETLNKFLERVYTKVSNIADMSFYKDEENSGFSFEEIAEKLDDIRLQLFRSDSNKFKNFLDDNKDYKVIFI